LSIKLNLILSSEGKLYSISAETDEPWQPLEAGHEPKRFLYAPIWLRYFEIHDPNVAFYYTFPREEKEDA
jgi:hypothetical protein